MDFGMILKNLRKEKGLTQAQLGAKIGVTEKTINNYETKGKRPRNIDVYYKLSEVFNVDMSDLVGEEEAFYYNAQKQYGYNGKKQARELAKNLSGMFAGGELPEEDADVVFKMIQEAYWKMKLENKAKYSNKTGD